MKKRSENKYVKKWKPPIFLYCALGVLGMILSVAVGTIYEKGDLIYSILEKMGELFSEHPFSRILAGEAFRDNIAVTGKVMVMMLLVLMVYIILDVTKVRDFMPGMEHGTARWATAEEISEKLMDKKNPSFNRVYSEHLRISMNDKKTKINNNVLVIGGSGTGKSYFLLTPNLYQADKDSKYPGSYIFTDPKGELLEKNGALLKERGYRVKVLNLVGEYMDQSDRFNPFVYVRTEEDIRKLITNLMDNTNPPNQNGGDPFWQKAETMFLKSLFLLVWMEHERLDVPMNMESVLMFLNKAEVNDKGKSPLDAVFARLVATSEEGENHPAYVAYHAAMTGAADTIRSIVITANARMDIFKSKKVLRVLSGDDMDLASIGTGKVNGKENVKTALFCIIPDSDTTYNCIAGMLYTMLFQELYYQADFLYHGVLPIPVTFWLDEFANIALPDNFLKMITTMRSRNISCVVIIQGLSQLKTKWEKEWEIIPDNCDVCVYLGGNGQSTFKYISENLGKRTIHKRTHGESKGSHGSTSSNEDVTGRELMMPEEVREIENDYCVIFVRAQKPVLDYKFMTDRTVTYQHSVELGAYKYQEMKERDSDLTIEILSSEEIKKEEILTIEMLEKEVKEDSFFLELRKIAAENVAKKTPEKKRVVRHFERMSVKEILMELSFSTKELFEITEGIKNGLSEEEVKSYMFLQDPELMLQKRMVYETFRERDK